MPISSATFIENIVIFIRNLIRTNVTDPLSRTDGVGFVMTAYPKRKPQYPIVTVKQTNISTVKLGMVSEIHDATVELEIRIWSRNSKEVDELSSDVIEVLRTNQYGVGSTDVEEIHGFTITSANPIVEVDGDNSIHSKVLGVNYRAILS